MQFSKSPFRGSYSLWGPHLINSAGTLPGPGAFLFFWCPADIRFSFIWILIGDAETDPLFDSSFSVKSGRYSFKSLPKYLSHFSVVMGDISSLFFVLA